MSTPLPVDLPTDSSIPRSSSSPSFDDPLSLHSSSSLERPLKHTSSVLLESRNHDSENRDPSVKEEGKEGRKEGTLSRRAFLTSAGSVNSSNAQRTSLHPPLRLGAVVADTANEPRATESSSAPVDPSIPVVYKTEKEEIEDLEQRRAKLRTELEASNTLRAHLHAEKERLTRKVDLMFAVVDATLRGQDLMTSSLEERLDAQSYVLPFLDNATRTIRLLASPSIPTDYLADLASDPSAVVPIPLALLAEPSSRFAQGVKQDARPDPKAFEKDYHSSRTLESCCEMAGEDCVQRGAGMLLCGKCLAVAYCSKAHQRSDFQRHKLACTEPTAYHRYCYELLRTKVALPASTPSIDDVD